MHPGLPKPVTHCLVFAAKIVVFFVLVFFLYGAYSKVAVCLPMILPAWVVEYKACIIAAVIGVIEAVVALEDGLSGQTHLLPMALVAFALATVATVFEWLVAAGILRGWWRRG